jgi:hypothetical protein
MVSPVPEDPVVVDTVAGQLQAQIIRGLLTAQGLHPVLSGEAAGQATGLVLGPMGEVQILVPASEAEEAKRLIDDYYADRLDSSG